MTDNTLPPDAMPPVNEVAERNLERLLASAYRPETPAAEFLHRVESQMLAAGRERTASARPSRRLRPFFWAVAAAAALTSLVLLLRAYLPSNVPDGGVVIAPGPFEEVSGPTPVPIVDAPSPARLTPRPRPSLEPAVAVALQAKVQTEPKERRRALLPDGSLLYLNQGSSVTIDAARQLTLTAGEVFIEVVPRSEPFVVKAGEREVTALGTRFSVRATASGPGVTVTQGKVKVSGYDGVLSAGEQLAPGSTRPAPAPRAAHVLEWTRELMCAAEAPLVPPSAHSGGALVVNEPSGQKANLSLRKYHVDLHIEDGFARTTIDQTYFNHTMSRLEGTFHFPLPSDASLSRLAMYVDGKLMEGGMAERDHARQTFESIVRRMQDPALLEWVDGHTFKMRVFPLEPRQEKRIVISYTQRLPVQYGRTTYRFPAGHSLEAVRDWSFHARVKSGADLTWVSDSHGDLLKSVKEGKDLILDAVQHNVKVDRDIALALYDTIKGVDVARFSSAEHEGARYLMLRYRPHLPGNTERPRRDWVVVFESSGDRDPILARVQVDVVRTLLANAEHDDTFAVIAAGTRPHRFAPQLQPATQENVRAAVDFLDGTHLIGALDLGAAFSAAEPFVSEARNPYLVHVGAGHPALGELSAEALRKRLAPSVRYVGVGVGKRYNRAFMKETAERTGGYVTQINPDEPVAWRSFELHSALTAPRLLDVKVIDGTEKIAFLSPTNTISQGEEVCAVTRLEKGARLPDSVTVTGTLEGKTFHRTFPVEDVVTGAGYLPRTWAKQEIERLLAENAAGHKARIVALSMQSYVMTPFTSLLVLENEQMYQQFNVDRGRKDHWAMYPCPEKIPVVYEPQAGLADDGRKAPTTANRPSVDAVLETILVRTAPRLLEEGTDSTDARRVVTAREVYGGSLAVPLDESDLLGNLFGDVSGEMKQRGARPEPPSQTRGWGGLPGAGPVSGPVASGSSGRSVDGLLAPGGAGVPLGAGGSGGPGLAGGGMMPPGPMGGGVSGGGGFGMPPGTFNGGFGGGGFGGGGMGPGIGGGGRMRSPSGFPGMGISPQGAPNLGLGFQQGGQGRGLTPWDQRVLTSAGTPVLSFRENSGQLGVFSLNGALSDYELAFRLSETREAAQKELRDLVTSEAKVRVQTEGVDPVLYMRTLQRDNLNRIGQLKQVEELEKLLGSNEQLKDRLRALGVESAVKNRPTTQTATPFLGSAVRRASGLSLPTVRWAPLLYRRPAFVGEARAFHDLASYAPGLNTTHADILAVLVAEANLTPAALGRIDPAARTLIDGARAVGWQSIALTRAAGEPAVTIACDGSGRYAYERVLVGGLREQVICDGKELLHLYPELGLGSRRTLSRFHRAELSDLIPWALPPTKDLALGADITLGGERVVAITPHGAADRPEAAALHLVFTEDGRLAERRLTEIATSKVLHRHTYAADGTVKVFGAEGKELAVSKYQRLAGQAPDLDPDVRELVVLPLPLRSRVHILSKVPGGANASVAQLDKGTLDQLLASDSATGLADPLGQILAARFVSVGDQRPGLATLLCSAGANLTGVVVHGKHTAEPFGRYLARLKSPEHKSEDSLGQGLLRTLAEAQTLLQTWNAPGSVLGEVEYTRLLNYVREGRSPTLVWAVVDTVLRTPDKKVVAEGGRTKVQREVLLAARECVKEIPTLSYAVRYEYARHQAATGNRAAARQLFEELYREALSRGVRPPIDRSFRMTLEEEGKETDPWAALMREVSTRFLKEGRRIAAVALAWQCWEVGSVKLADELLAAALAGAEERELALTRLAAIDYFLQTHQLDRADALLTDLLKDRPFGQDAGLWRLASRLAAQRKQTARSFECLAQALEFEYRTASDGVDLEEVRQDYAALLGHYEKRASALATLEEKVPTDFAARVIRAADRWRALDPEPRNACQLASRVLRLLGEYDQAWEYQLTASSPGEGGFSWTALAQTLNQEEEHELADRALVQASAAEPGNAELVWARAQTLLRRGRPAEARALVRQVAEGTWAPQYQGIQTQARQLVEGR